MDYKLIDLARKLSQYKKIVFYGAGYMARQIYDNLSKINIVVDFCIVTEKQGDCLMQEFLTVYQIDECVCDLKNDDTVILIAVSELYENDIEGILRSRSISNYLKYSDFITENKTSEYSIERGIEEIIGWEIVKLKKDWKEFEALKRSLEEEINAKRSNTILFIIGDLLPRTLKIMKAVRNTGEGIKAIFFPNATVNFICKEEFIGLGIAHTECACIQELIHAVIMEHAKIVHMFCGWEGDQAISYQLMKMKSVLPPLVYDKYDIVNEFYINVPDDIKEYERFCLENADGICERWGVSYLSQCCGYHFKGKILQFADYCGDDDMINYASMSDDKLSICYAGGIVTEKEYPNFSASCWLELAKKCKDAHCHLHIYPFAWHEAAYSEYIELGTYNEFWHFHYPIPHQDLSRELSKHDYGILPIRAGFLESDVNGYYKREVFIYANPNKFYDYLDAGIPIISAAPVIAAKNFESMGCLLPWTIDEYDLEYNVPYKVDTTRRRDCLKCQLPPEEIIDACWG